MLMSAETDVVRAFTALFTANAPLVAALPGGLTTDLADDQPLETPRALPYAILTVTVSRPQRPGYGWWLDFRRVTLEVYGNGKMTLGDLCSLIHATFDWPVSYQFPWSDLGSGRTVYHAWTR